MATIGIPKGYLCITIVDISVYLLKWVSKKVLRASRKILRNNSFESILSSNVRGSLKGVFCFYNLNLSAFRESLQLSLQHICMQTLVRALSPTDNPRPRLHINCEFCSLYLSDNNSTSLRMARD